MATYDITTVDITQIKLQSGDILNCPYTGEGKILALPKGIYDLKAWGAQGGDRGGTTLGGKGGYSFGRLTLREQETILYLYTGGKGGSDSTGKSSTTTPYEGGFNGGGWRDKYPGGGGASDIRIGTDSYYARVLVAGGGGSCGAKNTVSGNKQLKGTGGAGGGLSGEYDNDNTYGTYGNAGSSTGFSGTTSITPATSICTTHNINGYPGGFGFGGYGIYRGSGYGGAGGGGWYGGCGVYPDNSTDDEKGGGGGSGFAFTISTKSQVPEGYLLSSKYYLMGGTTYLGTESFVSPSGENETGHAGDGYIQILIRNVQPQATLYVKINGEWYKC